MMENSPANAGDVRDAGSIPGLGRSLGVGNGNPLQNGLPWWSNGKESACNAGDVRDAGSIPGLGRSHGGGRGNPLQYSRLENPMDRGAWWATVRRVTESQTRLKQLSRRFMGLQIIY